MFATKGERAVYEADDLRAYLEAHYEPPVLCADEPAGVFAAGASAPADAPAPMDVPTWDDAPVSPSYSAAAAPAFEPCCPPCAAAPAPAPVPCHSSRAAAPRSCPAALDELLDDLDEGFSPTLLHLIDERGMTDAQAYRRANVSRQLFSKIRKDPGYRPAKQTVLAFAVALGLTPDGARDLLERAGFALSRSSRSDVIVEYFLTRGENDVMVVNQALYDYGEPLLGSA